MLNMSASIVFFATDQLPRHQSAVHQHTGPLYYTVFQPLFFQFIMSLEFCLNNKKHMRNEKKR